ncbi:Uncharacterised protein [Vibrio cholerae]|nr:Uncharacterised protein [Vibrio cholerae]
MQRSPTNFTTSAKAGPVALLMPWFSKCHSRCFATYSGSEVLM